jgi:hypothetical protein
MENIHQWSIYQKQLVRPEHIFPCQFPRSWATYTFRVTPPVKWNSLARYGRKRCLSKNYYRFLAVWLCFSVFFEPVNDGGKRRDRVQTDRNTEAIRFALQYLWMNSSAKYGQLIPMIRGSGDRYTTNYQIHNRSHGMQFPYLSLTLDVQLLERPVHLSTPYRSGTDIPDQTVPNRLQNGPDHI